MEIPKYRFYGYKSDAGFFYASRDAFFHEEGYWDGLSGDAMQLQYIIHAEYLAGYKLGKEERIERLYK